MTAESRFNPDSIDTGNSVISIDPSGKFRLRRTTRWQQWNQNVQHQSSDGSLSLISGSTTISTLANPSSMILVGALQ